MEQKIQEFMLSLGISPANKGFRAICVGVRILLEHPEYENQATKVLYPAIAAECGTTAKGVERNIRTSVERLFDTQDKEKIVRTLKLTPDKKKGIYTNSEFLTVCALRLGGSHD